MNQTAKIELLNQIPFASAVRKETEKTETYKKELLIQIGYINSSIEKAKKEGKTNCTFSPHHYYEDELKRLYKEKGYFFKPTGYVGAVYQMTEEICW